MTQKANFIEDQQRSAFVELTRHYINAKAIKEGLNSLKESGEETDVEIIDAHGDIKIFKCNRHTAKQLEAMCKHQINSEANSMYRIRRYEKMK